MPVLSFRSNIALSADHRRELLRDASDAVERLLRSGVCSVLAHYIHCDILLDGTAEPAVYAEVQSIAPPDERVSRDLCSALLDIVNCYEQVDPSRVYVYLPVVNAHSAWKFIDGQPVSTHSILSERGGQQHGN
ncbi:MAG: hypothetical protein JW863_17660 [Chitinispirillaceae bacterium]|nr:hypothetical protein [Chitinispirillaceae bacterium]